MSTTVRVATSAPYDVHVGSGILNDVARSTGDRDVVAVLTDENVERLHGAALSGLESVPRIVIPPGEDSKSLTRLESVLEELVRAGLSRSSCLVAFGGGVVGDLGGLAAALYQRGIDFVQVPTTLLSQVDSSVGGKTAVNLEGGKNLAGVFQQPIAVFADCSVLSTLSDAEFQSGLGEVIKSALIGDAELFELLEQNSAAINARDASVLATIVKRCVRVKAAVVAQDERESGPRKQLNLGHTFAHGIEHAAGFGTIPHGIAVAVGLELATNASVKLGMCDPSWLERLRELAVSLNLPCDLASLRERFDLELSAHALREGMRHDKKGQSGDPRFVLIEGAESVRWDIELKSALLDELLA